MDLSKFKYHYIVNKVDDPLSFDTIDLLQIGVAHCDCDATIDEHKHSDYYELSIITSGHGTITTNGIESAVEKDDIYLSLPHDRHRLDSAVDSRMNYYFFAFRVTDKTLGKQMKILARLMKNERRRIFRSDTLTQLVAAAIAEIDSFRLYKDSYISALFTQAIIQILRSNIDHTVKDKRFDTKKEICYQIMSYINAHIYTLTNLTDLSAALNYHYPYLSKTFVETTSQTISDYYIEQRLETACMLIREGNLSITQISDKLHYSSIYAFSKAFKNHYGVSPKEYKNTIEITETKK